MSLTTISNRRCDGSTESGSDDSDDEYLTDHHQIIRTQRQPKISSFERRKEPHYEELTVIKPCDPAFDWLMKCCYYLLTNTWHVRLAEESKKLREQVKTFQVTFETTKFSGEDPILVFDFLTVCVEEADTLGVSEAHAFLIMPKLLESRAKRHLRSIRNGARSGGVTCRPETVNHFLRTYATPAAIRNAVNDLRNIRQQPWEDERTYSRRINVAAHRCGNVCDEIDKMTLFVNGLLPNIQTIVASLRESKGRRQMSYEEHVQYVQGEGESYRARISSLRVAKLVNTNARDRVVHFIEQSPTNRRSVEDNE